MNKPVDTEKLKPADYATDQEVRWCPGCGDYAILKCVQRTFADLEVDKSKTVFVSGIGCSSRFPYYMDTYGFHTIHGRAPSVATGVKLANPELDVWVVTGDGDGFSIGGNHLMHALRRNVDFKILLFNNEIYGLTKGQYSPTSQVGTRSPSTPMGSVDLPLSPCKLALGAGAKFIARTIDTDQKHMPEVFKRVHAYKGAAFVEIFQNCIVYNDAVFASFTEKKTAADRQLHAIHGEPLIYGKDRDKGIIFNPKTFQLEIAAIGENGVTESDIVVHDETNANLADLLINMTGPDVPTVLGIIYAQDAPTFEQAVVAQVEAAQKNGKADLGAHMREGRTWTVS